MKYILQRILIGTGIALAIWFIKDTCFAATTVDQYVYRTVYTQCATVVPNPFHPDEYVCSTIGMSQQTSTFTQFGNQTVGPKEISQYYVRMGTPSTSTSQFQANQTCTTTFDINYNPRNSQTTSTLEGIPTFQYFNGSDYVDMDNGRMSIVRGSDDYSYKVSFTYTPTVQTRYIYVNIDLPSPVVRGSSSQAVNFRNGSTVCATSSTDTAIIEGTSQIVGAVEGVGSQAHNDALDIKGVIQSFHSTVTSAFTGDGSSPSSVGNSLDPYSSSGLQNKEGQVNWDVNSNAFDLDTQSWSTPFSVIFNDFTTIINYDSTFLSYIIFMLTFSFLCLVVGRK